MAKRALLVGAGGMGKAWAKALAASPGVSLAGWVDIREGAAIAASEELGLAFEHFGTELSNVIDASSPDFVVDVTIPEAHHDVTLAALSRGLPVIGEKPMASSMAEARAMVAASEKADKLYMVSQSRRYNPYIAGYRDAVSALGVLGIVNADFYIGAHFGGFRDEMPSPLVLDMAIHTFDEARFLTGLDPVAVYAEEFNPAWSWYKGDACATAIFEMEGGVRFTYRGSWCAEGCHSSWDGDWRIVGEKGTALWYADSVLKGEKVKVSGGFFADVEDLPMAQAGLTPGIAGSLKEFLIALDGGPTPNGECHDNIKSLAMVFGAIESSRSGSRVAISV
jgi:predicted dehydrogenase